MINICASNVFWNKNVELPLLYKLAFSVPTVKQKTKEQKNLLENVTNDKYECNDVLSQLYKN